jgi:hypothetical protein
MIVPPSQSLEKIESTPGFSVVLRDQSGTPVYRRVLENPIRRDVEVFSPDPKQSINRTPVEQSKGTFVILVPEIEGARTLEFHGNPLHPRAHLEPPKLIARFMLTSTEEARRG